MRTISIVLGLLLSVSIAHAEANEAPQAKPRVQHIPLHETLSGGAKLRFRVTEPDRVREIHVHVLRAGAAPEMFVALREDRDYVAPLPDAAVQPPGFSYWATMLDAEQKEQPVFANEMSPHAVQVHDTDERAGELRRLAAHDARRSSSRVGAEYVDFGARRLDPSSAKLHDRYYRVEVGYGYAFYTWVEDIRLSVVRVRGESGWYDDAQGGAPSILNTGIDYGHSEVTLMLHDAFRLRGGLLLGASQDGFEMGASGALILGDPLTQQLTLSATTISTMGATVNMRLGFLASARVPMGASVEVSEFPLGEDFGVRLLYDAGYRFASGIEVLVSAGYQGRTSVTGGPSVGTRVTYAF